MEKFATPAEMVKHIMNDRRMMDRICIAAVLGLVQMSKTKENKKSA